MIAARCKKCGQLGNTCICNISKYIGEGVRKICFRGNIHMIGLYYNAPIVKEFFDIEKAIQNIDKLNTVSKKIEPFYG